MNKVNMNNISQSLDKFIEALKGGQPVAVNANNEWFIEGWLARTLRTFSLGENRRLAELALSMITSLDEIEKVSIRFNSSQPVAFDRFIEAAELVLSLINNSQNLQNIKHQLQRRIIGLKFRLEGINGGFDKGTVQEIIKDKLITMAAEWKLQEAAFSDKELTSKEIEQLDLTVRYAQFADLILSDKAIRQEFFAWTLRDNNEVTPFIQFPSTQQKISASNLQGRIGRMGGEKLKISIHGNQGIQEKILTLPFEGQDINILDDQKMITFRGNYKLTISEVFEIFKNKNILVGELEFLKDGIVNWNVHKLGWWNADKNEHEVIDIAKPGWWKQLPFFEVLTKKQAKERYGNHIDGNTWNAAASATRGSASLDFDQTHAFIELAIPMNNGNYAIYDFGKFATQFPSNFIESLSMVCHTVEATIAFPDENIFYTHRQHALRSFALSPDKGMKLMESIRLDIIKARSGNLVYQIESENCAKWLHEKLEGVIGQIPNLFKMHLLDTEPNGFMSLLFEMIKWLPRGLQIPVLTALHLPFGAAKEARILENGEIVCRSLRTHRFWETGEIYLPAFLHKQLESGLLSHIDEINGNQNVSFEHQRVEQPVTLMASIAGMLNINHKFVNSSSQKDTFVAPNNLLPLYNISS